MNKKLKKALSVLLISPMLLLAGCDEENPKSDYKDVQISYVAVEAPYVYDVTITNKGKSDCTRRIFLNDRVIENDAETLFGNEILKPGQSRTVRYDSQKPFPFKKDGKDVWGGTLFRFKETKVSLNNPSIKETVNVQTNKTVYLLEYATTPDFEYVYDGDTLLVMDLTYDGVDYSTSLDLGVESDEEYRFYLDVTNSSTFDMSKLTIKSVKQYTRKSSGTSFNIFSGDGLSTILFISMCIGLATPIIAVCIIVLLFMLRRRRLARRSLENGKK